MRKCRYRSDIACWQGRSWCNQLVKTPCPETLSAYWPFVRGIHRLPVVSHHKGPSYAEFWCFRWCSLKQTVEQTVELPVIWDVLTLMWLYFNRWLWFYPKCNIQHGSVDMFSPLHPIARPRGRHIECPIFRSMFYLCGDQYMMTSSNGIISTLLAICAGKSPVNFPHKGQWREALMFSLICAWMNAWVNNREDGDFRRHRAHYDVTAMNCRSVHIIISWR